MSILMSCIKQSTSNGSYENKKCNESGESIKYELRRCEVETLGKVPDDPEDAARQHDTKMLYWYVNKMRGTSQSGFVPVWSNPPF